MKPHKWQKEIIAWSNGKQIQGRYRSDDWVDLPNPSWCLEHEYRIKPEEFKWQKEKDHWEKGGTIQWFNGEKWVDLKKLSWIENCLPPKWEDCEWRIKPEETRIEYSFNDEVKESVKNIIIKVEDKTKLLVEINFN